MPDIVTGEIIGLAIKVHKALGPGLLESAYKECLFYELCENGFDAKKEMPIPLIYNGIMLECGYRADILIGASIIIEVKAIKTLDDIHLTQMLSYLKLANCKVGLLINFNVLQLKDGIKRVTNGY